MQPSSQQVSAQGTVRIVSEIQGQINTIRSAIQECVLSYPGGDATIDISISGSDPSARTNYPIKPNSSHYTGATLGPTAGRLVKDIRCPGDPGDDKNHTKIFSGSSGKFMPPPPQLFEDWEYYNGPDGVFFWTKTNKTDAFLSTALEKLDEISDECEADIIDATSGAKVLDSGSQTSCLAGYICFRLRMTVLSTAVYNGDTDGDETAASCP